MKYGIMLTTQFYENHEPVISYKDLGLVINPPGFHGLVAKGCFIGQVSAAVSEIYEQGVSVCYQVCLLRSLF